MSFPNNLDYLYEHLPAFMRRQDSETSPPLFLKRFLSWFGGELDGFDGVIDTLHERVAWETADEEWLNWLLWACFGWAWFPVWMTLAQKRAFYRDIATHYARRGTARGIVEFLAAFGIRSRVIVDPLFYDSSYTTDDDSWVVETPLVIIVQIFPQTDALPEELVFYGEWTTDQDAIADPALVPTRPDLDALLRFQKPAGQVIIVEDKIAFGS
jgi:phage tail-like protein